MATIGERSQLKILRENSPGFFLDSQSELGEILLPRNETDGTCGVGDTVDVFIYCDSEDRPIATMKNPKAMPGSFAALECIATTKIGAFLDWGLTKDLFVPFREQTSRLDIGKTYVVYIYVDPNSDRIVASRRINRHLSKEEPDYQVGQEVELMVYAKTELGYKAIINGRHSGVLFANEVFKKPAPGEQLTGYVTQVRSDGKIDLSLQSPDQSRQQISDDLESRIETELIARGGSWELCDSSPPEAIYEALGVSKKAFKKATGALFRKHKITIGKDGIRSVK
ncbi:MAG: GntR family transcriptional regulator [Verrucomicrobiae bacterium]|nr:GntR family transcriptional regulator [Verrucomicrobiae bacterium]NNJ86815.1 GntR family transcriptional regulator [Akkermansiaceae bacterium]